MGDRVSISVARAMGQVFPYRTFHMLVSIMCKSLAILSLPALLLISLPQGTLAASGADVNEIANEVAGDVKALADPSPEKRAAAELRLYASGSEGYPAIEAAAEHKGLPPAVSAKLREIIQSLQPLNGARQRVARSRAAIAEWNEQTMLDAYQRSGTKNPTWDDAVKAAVSTFAHQGPAADATRNATDRVIRLGCTDPMVGIMAAKCAELAPSPDHNRVDDLYKAAVPAIQASRYPDDRKFDACVQYALHLAQHGEKFDLRGLPPPPPDAGGQPLTVHGPRTQNKSSLLLKQALAVWPQVVKENGIPPVVVKQLASAFITAATYPKGDRKAAFDQVYPALEAAMPNSTAPLEFKGRFYVEFAWEARGGGWAKDVSPANAKTFQQRLAIAEHALTKAADMSPNETEAPTVMLHVELGEGRGRAVMENWFSRAIKADPDNVEAYRMRMRYLEPKWYGSVKELKAFSESCRKSKNWVARLPIISLDVHEALAEASGNSDAYYKSPEVWRDVESVLRPWLEAFPNDASGRSRYTYFACKCGHWDEAKRQFALLGDRAIPDQFGDPAFLVLYRQEASRH